MVFGLRGQRENRWIGGAESETLYTSAERDHLRGALVEKYPPVATPLFML